MAMWSLVMPQSYPLWQKSVTLWRHVNWSHQLKWLVVRWSAEPLLEKVVGFWGAGSGWGSRWVDAAQISYTNLVWVQHDPLDLLRFTSAKELVWIQIGLSPKKIHLGQWHGRVGKNKSSFLSVTPWLAYGCVCTIACSTLALDRIGLYHKERHHCGFSVSEAKHRTAHSILIQCQNAWVDF